MASSSWTLCTATQRLFPYLPGVTWCDLARSASPASLRAGYSAPRTARTARTTPCLLLARRPPPPCPPSASSLPAARLLLARCPPPACPSALLLPAHLPPRPPPPRPAHTPDACSRLIACLQRRAQHGPLGRLPAGLHRGNDARGGGAAGSERRAPRRVHLRMRVCMSTRAGTGVLAAPTRFRHAAPCACARMEEHGHAWTLFACMCMNVAHWPSSPRRRSLPGAWSRHSCWAWRLLTS
eukprot:354980-Chlamydomonas_euryale.AAC.2